MTLEFFLFRIISLYLKIFSSQPKIPCKVLFLAGAGSHNQLNGFTGIGVGFLFFKKEGWEFIMNKEVLKCIIKSEVSKILYLKQMALLWNTLSPDFLILFPGYSDCIPSWLLRTFKPKNMVCSEERHDIWDKKSFFIQLNLTGSGKEKSEEFIKMLKNLLLKAA